MKGKSYAEQVAMVHYYHVCIEGCLANFEIGDGGVEACELYPEVKYTTVHEYMKHKNSGAFSSSYPPVGSQNQRPSTQQTDPIPKHLIINHLSSLRFLLTDIPLPHMVQQRISLHLHTTFHQPLPLHTNPIRFISRHQQSMANLHILDGVVHTIMRRLSNLVLFPGLHIPFHLHTLHLIKVDTISSNSVIQPSSIIREIILSVSYLLNKLDLDIPVILKL
ncbi:hypothetical protein AHAS_Ahas02G0005700 [Arachis hypogaea]